MKWTIPNLSTFLPVAKHLDFKIISLKLELELFRDQVAVKPCRSPHVLHIGRSVYVPVHVLTLFLTFLILLSAPETASIYRHCTVMPLTPQRRRLRRRCGTWRKWRRPWIEGFMNWKWLNFFNQCLSWRSSIKLSWFTPKMCCPACSPPPSSHLPRRRRWGWGGSWFDLGCPMIVWIWTRSGLRYLAESRQSTAQSLLVGVRAGVASGNATEVVDGGLGRVGG